MERNNDSYESLEGAIREGYPPFRDAVDPESSDLPPLSQSDAVKRELNTKRRKRALCFFWISLSVFGATMIGAILRYRQLSTVPTVEIIGDSAQLFFLTLIGIFISLLFCALGIRHKGAIILIIVEAISFVLVLLPCSCLTITGLMMSRPKK